MLTPPLAPIAATPCVFRALQPSIACPTSPIRHPPRPPAATRCAWPSSGPCRACGPGSACCPSPPRTRSGAGLCAVCACCARCWRGARQSSAAASRPGHAALRAHAWPTPPTTPARAAAAARPRSGAWRRRPGWPRARPCLAAGCCWRAWRTGRSLCGRATRVGGRKLSGVDAGGGCWGALAAAAAAALPAPPRWTARPAGPALDRSLQPTRGASWARWGSSPGAATPTTL